MTYSELQIVVETKHSHLSNVELLGYLDEARYNWYEYCISIGVEALVVHMSTDFKKEVFNHDKINIYTQIERIGNTSFTLQQQVQDQHQTLVASSQIVLTTVNRQTRKKVRVPEEIRKLLKGEGELTLNFNSRCCSP
ncbi:acyl-CoA thioesterase [Alkalihalobacterium elongatum]|uniref:acyl-CoA thioesterase n=1 Tax=Alkalihalobacterium elongatum TaxID=2675466 RepID=UPI001C1F818C|nr:thioesterase family protein [Alkalihalobacterium elongatum]